MPRHYSNVILRSLKGKIWLAVSALAVFNCISGLLAYLAASFLISDPFFSVFITFFLSAITTLGFGWWVSNEVLTSIDRVNLAAKSLERSPSATLPKTTGANETDELLQSLSRGSRQLQTLIAQMDDLALGKVTLPQGGVRNSDRLFSSFHNLVTKVTDSIDAKTELDEILGEIQRIVKTSAPVKDGNLNIELNSGHAATRELTDTLNYLIGHLNRIVVCAHNTTSVSATAAELAKDSIRNAIANDDSKAGKTKRITASLIELPERMRKVSDEFSETFMMAEKVLETFEACRGFSRENVTALNTLRKQVNDIARKIQVIKERSRQIPKAARSADDISRRTNLIAMNMSVQTGQSGASNGLDTLVSEEIDSLSHRAGRISKEIAEANEAIIRDLTDLESTLAKVRADMTLISKQAMKSDDSLSDLEKGVTRIFDLKSKIPAALGERAADNEQSLHNLEDLAGNVGIELRSSEQNIAKLTQVVRELRDAIGDFKIADLRPTSPSAQSEPDLSDEYKPLTDDGFELSVEN